MRRVALILHAHLPWVRVDPPWDARERWFHEAVWECYLPLLRWLERSHVHLTLSISPPLAAMLRDAELIERSREHVVVLSELNHEHAPSGELRQHYAALLDVDAFDAAHPGQFLERVGRLRNVEKMTTSASHAFLPGLVPAGGVQAQLALGRACWPEAGDSMWLPECAWTPEVDEALATLDVRATVLAEHGVTLSRPAVAARGLVSTRGVAYLARHRTACHRIWSKQDGYPGHGTYRDFYRDLGMDAFPLGPFKHQSMIGLKYHRITDRGGGEKALYDPVAARARVAIDARDFVDTLVELDGDVVLAFDAELFGHWWHEGVGFLASIADHLASRGVPTTTLSSLAENELPVAEPARSTWGRGGYARDWVNPATIDWWRQVHRARRDVSRAVDSHIDAIGERGAALDHAIEAVLHAEASDWIYMLSSSDQASFARARLTSHLRVASRMAAIACGARPTFDDRRALARDRTVTSPIEASELRRLFTSR